MWTNENRARYDRSKLRYPSDVTDDKSATIGPMIPPVRRGGNKGDGRRARGPQRLDVYAEHRLPVEGDPE